TATGRRICSWDSAASIKTAGITRKLSITIPRRDKFSPAHRPDLERRWRLRLSGQSICCWETRNAQTHVLLSRRQYSHQWETNPASGTRLTIWERRISGVAHGEKLSYTTIERLPSRASPAPR